MTPLIILAVPVLAATSIAMASCILAGRTERFLDDPVLDEDAYQPVLRPTRASTDPVPIPVRFVARPDRTET